MSSRINTGRALGSLLSIAMLMGSACPAAAADSILGTLETSGDVWVARHGEDWNEMQSSRPIVTGDRLRTGGNGYVIADLGESGVLGLFATTQIRAAESGAGTSVAVEAGKVAFHLSKGTKLSLVAADSLITTNKSADGVAAHGFVELNEAGDAVIVLEDGAASVVVDGEVKSLRAGERLLVTAAGAAGGDALASASEDDEQDQAAGILRGDDAAAGGVVAGSTVAGDGTAAAVAATAVPSNAAAIGLGALAVVAGGVAIGSSGGDSNGSP